MPAFSKAASKADVRGSQGSRMRRGGFLSRFEATDFQGNDWFMLSHFAGNFHKFYSIRNGFHVQHDDLRVRIVCEHGQHVRFVDIGLIAEADDLRKAEALSRAQSTMAAANAPEWEMKPMPPCVGMGGWRKVVSSGRCVSMRADAIGTEQTDAMCARDLETLLFERRAFRADFTEPASDNDCGFDPALTAIFDGFGRCIRRDNENRKVNGIRDFAQTRVDRTPEQLALFLADEMDRAPISAGDEVARHAVTEFFRRGGCADDNDAFGIEEGGEG